MSAVRMDHIRDIVKEDLIGEFAKTRSFAATGEVVKKKLSGLNKRLAEKKFTSNEDGLLSISVAVASADGKVIYTSAAGERDPLHCSGEPVTEDTLYNLGSISKFILMTLALRLMQQNKLNFQTTIKEVLPQLELPGFAAITIHHLLSHHSGLKDCDYIELKEHDPIVKLLKYKENNIPDLAGYPGENFYYANINYVLIAHIIQTVTRMSLLECFQHYIGNELKLNHTTIIDQGNSTLPVAAGYKPDLNLTGVVDCSNYTRFGASSFRSTPSDLACLMAHFFNDDLFISPDYRNIVIQSVKDVMFEVITSTDVYRWPAKMGLGIEAHEVKVDDSRTIKTFGHGGWQNGHAAYLVYAPSEQRAYCCCVSKTQGLQNIKSPRDAHAFYASKEAAGVEESDKLSAAYKH